MIVSLFAAVLLIQLLIYVVNAVGAKTINELVGSQVPLARNRQLTH